MLNEDIIDKPKPVVQSEKEAEIDLYYCVHPQETEATIRHYLELFPHMDEEVLMLLEQASRGREEFNERFIQVAQEMVDKRNAELLANFGRGHPPRLSETFQ